MNIVELFARIGLKTDEGKAKSFHRAMTTVKLGLIATTAVAAGTALAIRKITSEAMAGAVAFKQFETETGASAQELQKWQSVAEQTNQSAESVSAAIKAIVSNQEKIKLGQGDISGYQILGIDPRQDPFKILEDLRVKTKNLSDGMKKNILSQMGVGVGMLQTLSLTREEFDKMAGRAWIISPQAIETLNQTKSAVDLAARSINYMKTQIAVGLSPQIKKITKDFQAWMKVNEKGIIEGFKLGFKYVTLFVKAVYNAGSVINRVVSSTVGWSMAIKGFLGFILLLNSALLFSPIGIFVAGIVLLVAVLDDLFVYSKGGKSLFGTMMKEFPEMEKALFGSFETIKDVLKLMKAFGSGDIGTIDEITKKWGKFGEIVKSLHKAFGEAKKLMVAFFSGDIDKIDEITGEWGAFGEIIKTLYEAFKSIKGLKLGDLFGAFFDTDIEKIKEVTKEWGLVGKAIVLATEGLIALQKLIDPEGVGKTWGEHIENTWKDLSEIPEKLNRLLSGDVGISEVFTGNRPAGNTTKTTTQHINTTIHITEAIDPAATGREVGKAMQREINAASAQLSRNQ